MMIVKVYLPTETQWTSPCFTTHSPQQKAGGQNGNQQIYISTETS
ncbi:hypothetical protein J2Z23_002252 [Lederbergia galactosidilyticus]|nr:hypothetical protein [Lederbergia galactosidilytica]